MDLNKLIILQNELKEVCKLQNNAIKELTCFERKVTKQRKIINTLDFKIEKLNTMIDVLESGVVLSNKGKL